MRRYYVYMMANAGRMLYTGVTNDLERRVFEHRHKLIKGYASKYDITRLVYYESTSNVLAAIAREKQIERVAATQEDRPHRVGESGLARLERGVEPQPRLFACGSE